VEIGNPNSKVVEPLEEVSSDPYAAHEEIKRAIADLKRQTAYQRSLFERSWFRNLLYYAGNQWVSFDRNSRQYRERRLRKWVPKPVTNRFASTCNSIAAAIENIKPDVSYRPSTMDPEDIAAAAVCEQVTPVIDNETQVKTIKARLAKWTTLTGNAYARPSYDLTWEAGARFVQHIKCKTCGTTVDPAEVDVIPSCPECGGQYFDNAREEDGSPIGTDLPIGIMSLDVLSPFEVFLDMQNEGIKSQHQILTIQSMDLGVLERTWQLTAKDVKAETLDELVKEAFEYRNAIAFITESSNFSTNSGGDRIPRANVHRIDRLPDSLFPEGLYAILVGDKVVEALPLAFKHHIGDREVPFLNYVQFGYEAFPGRHYYKTPADDLIPKQDQRNRFESLIELQAMRGAYNTWLLPTGSGITSLTGEPGQQVTWDPSNTNGASPQFIQGQGIAMPLVNWVKIIDEDFEELAGTFDVMKGNVPKGVSAGYAIQLLTERGFSRFGSVFENWENAWQELRRQELSIFRVYATEERISTIMGKHGEWETQKFIGADIHGAVDVIIESGESRPKSQLSMQASIEQLIKLGIIDPADPEQKYRIAEKYGMASVLAGVDVDRREAAREFEAFMQQQPPIVQIWVDAHQVHMGQHGMDAKSDEFKRLPIELRKFWSAHIEAHAKAEMIKALTIQGGMLGPMGPGMGAGGGEAPIVAPGGEGMKSPAPSVQVDQTNNVLRSK
jgi:predicted  nucleic acid-binding Zn-ribbon protein